MSDSTTMRQKEMFDERVRQQDAALPGYADLWNLLRGMLLTHGGTEVVPPLTFETEILELAAGITVSDGEAALLVGGEPSNCHENVKSLLDSDANFGGETATENWTGYALSDDGLWRQHSWAVSNTGRTMETTVRRKLYAGIRVN